MKSWRILLMFIFLLGELCVCAQEAKKDTTELFGNKNLLVTLTDGIATGVRHTGRKIRKVGKEFNNIDTFYIAPNLYNLAFMLEHSAWYEYYRLGGVVDRQRQSLDFSPNMDFKLGIYFGWRWIFLGYTFDVKDLFGGNKDKAKKTEYALNIYSSKFGVDLYYRKTGSDFKIRSLRGFRLPSDWGTVDFDGLQSSIKGLNAYWIFNYKRFSYPAVYSQSTNQRRSAGSLMAGFSYSQHTVTFDASKLPVVLTSQLNDALRFDEVKFSDYSINIGYGYNWVFARNCVANLSLLPAISYKKSKASAIHVEKEEEHKFWDKWIKNINFDMITRAGVVYNNSKYFVGASFVAHIYDYKKENFSITNTFGTLRIYAGFNFWKKKEYRKVENAQK